MANEILRMILFLIKRDKLSDSRRFIPLPLDVF